MVLFASAQCSNTLLPAFKLRPHTRLAARCEPHSRCRSGSWRAPARVNHTQAATISASSAAAATEAVDRRPATVHLVKSQKGTYAVQGHMQSTASAAAVYDLLSDYSALSRVFSSVEHSEVNYSDGQKQVLQLCKWEFLVFSGTFKTLLSVAEHPDAGRLVFSLVSSPFMRDFQGQWQLTPLDNGGCNIEHRLTVAPVVAPPDSFAGYAQKIFTRQVGRVLEDLQKELCRQGYP